MADRIANINNEKDRKVFIENIIPFCYMLNKRFDENKFREWIERRIKGKSTKGLG